MDRSDEFLRVAEIFVPESLSKSNESILALGPKKPVSFSEFLQTVLVTYSVILENEDLVKRMARVSSLKEFTNDPTMNMQELSVQFEMKIKFIQSSIQKIKAMIEKGTRGNQDNQHRQLISQYLGKIISNQVQSFKLALKEHSKNVEDRNKRVQKYGNISSTTQSLLLADSNQTSKYAMFSNMGLSDSTPLVQIEKNQALRNRRPGVTSMQFQYNSNNNPETPGSVDDECAKGKPPSRYEPAKSSLFHQQVTSRQHLNAMRNTSSGNIGPSWMGGHTSPYLQASAQQQAPKPVTTDSRFRHAERVESSIREMGQLFTQMASLIAEQSEVITRIEDDVEIGHQNTIEGHTSLQQAYEITKGNRGMIIKIFLILIFCIFLFLVWT